MQKTDYFVDFHCHATLRAVNSAPSKNGRNLWEKTFNPEINTPVGRWARIQTKEILKESQTNLFDYAQGKTRVIFDSLYPVEKGWYQFRKLPNFLVGSRAKEELMLVAFGIEYDRMIALSTNDGYFRELQDSYDFLANGQGYSPDGKLKYKLVKNYHELDQILKYGSDTIAVVLNIEGAHALECGAPCTLNISESKLKDTLEQHISIIKQWEHPVFYMNLAHHFYNQLCGHARSFKSPISFMFNQDQGLDEGMYDLGWKVIEMLLSRKNGRRILIDTKHMSLRSRQDYYQFVTHYNKNYPEEKIPIICSHSGINGFETMEESAKVPDNMRKFKGKYFNTWSINLSDEEINLIHDSEGMIGIMMDKSVLGSKDTIKLIRSLPTVKEQKDAFIKLFLDNVLGTIKAVGKKSAWDIVSLGTDFDGVITHIDFYPTASTLEQFRNNLQEYLLVNNYKSEYWYGYSPQQLMDKLFRTNALSFLKKTFSVLTVKKNPSISIPKTGLSKGQILDLMKVAKKDDLKWQQGKSFCLIYYPGDEKAKLVQDAYNLFFTENAINPISFPSLRKFESEVISMASDLFNGSEKTTGNLTSGGTESILMAVKTARDLFEKKKPGRMAEILLPSTAHPAFHKACQYFKVKPVAIPVNDAFEADIEALKKSISPDTAMIVGSAPAYPHGIMDPLAEMSELAYKNNLLFHVDACIGGFILPFLSKIGEPVAEWDFRLKGVTSISADLHKYGYAAKGASVILYNNSELRKHQFYVQTGWHGGIYGSTGISGSKPGGAIAAAWAALMGIGEDGYMEMAKDSIETTKKLIKNISGIKELEILGNPQMTIFAFASSKINIFEVADELNLKGWHFERLQFPAAIHLTINQIHKQIVDQFLADLKIAVKKASRLKMRDFTSSIQVAAVKRLIKILPSGMLARFQSQFSGSSATTKARTAPLYGMMGALSGTEDLDEIVLELLDKLNSKSNL